MSDIQSAVNDYVTGQILHRPGEALDPALNLLQEGVLDSLGLQMLVAHLEETFGLTIGDADLMPENFETIAAIAALVTRLKGG